MVTISFAVNAVLVVFPPGDNNAKNSRVQKPTVIPYFTQLLTTKTKLVIILNDYSRPERLGRSLLINFCFSPRINPFDSITDFFFFHGPILNVLSVKYESSASFAYGHLCTL